MNLIKHGGEWIIGRRPQVMVIIYANQCTNEKAGGKWNSHEGPWGAFWIIKVVVINNI
jgi:hypothetical protein